MDQSRTLLLQMSFDGWPTESKSTSRKGDEVVVDGFHMIGDALICTNPYMEEVVQPVLASALAC